MHQEKVQQEKLKAVKARLNFEEVSQHSESGTPSRRRDFRKRLRSRRIRNGGVAAGNQEWKKSLPSWKQQEAGHKQNFKNGGFKNQHSSKDQPKTNKKGETSNKDKALAILMVQPWQRVVRQRITLSFPPDPDISFPSLEEEEGTEGPMIIEAKIRGHFIHRMYVDGGSASEIL
ncbi:hypothetical protein Tco_1147295, partial [Tanacetum coccineum]